MKNLLQTLSDIEPAKVEDKKRFIQEGVGPGQILNVYMDELDSASLRYLSGVRKTIEECGMAPLMNMPSSAPRPPATLNITAADAHELGALLKTMTGLNGVDNYEYEPVYRADPSPVHPANGDMKGMVKLIDDGEVEEEIIQDGMNTDVPVYDNSPNRETHGGKWPQEGDQNNSEVAAKDELVIRGEEKLTTESLMADYRAFISDENEKNLQEAWNVKTKVNPKEKGKYKGKTTAQLRKQLNSLKKSGPHKKGSKEYGKMRELQFAIRAKTGWGKVKKSN